MANMSNQILANTRKGQSNSLWNVSLQSGWSQLEYDLLRVGVMKFGIGKWNALQK